MKTIFSILPLLPSKKAKRVAMTTSIVAMLLIVLSSGHYLLQATISMAALIIQVYTYLDISFIYKGYINISTDQAETKEGMGWQVAIFIIMFISALLSWSLS